MSAQEIDETVTKRREFLAALSEEPATKPELVERLDTSRSTVDRAIEDLERHDFVTRPNDEYRLTLAGKQAYECHRSYLTGLENLAAGNDVLASFSSDTPFSDVMLDDAAVEEAEPHNPLQPLDLSAEIMSRATRIRKVSPAIFPVCIDTIAERANAGDMRVDLVASPDVVDALAEEYDGATSWIDTEGNSLYETADEPPYALWVAETPDGEYAGLLSHTDTGVRGLIVNDSDDACEWARGEYERYLDRATLVENFSERA